MPKKASSKNREWERERRERLNNCFKSLESLLPSNNPTASLSKVDIVKKAAEYIRELQKKNANLLEENTDKECLEQITLLERRVKELVDYSQLLASLLKAAGISVPPGPGPDLEVLLKRPLKWSGKLSLDQTLQQLAEARQKKITNNAKKKKNSSTGGQKTKENVINIKSIPQSSSNTVGNVVKSDIVQASTKNRVKSSVKTKKKLMKVPKTMVTVSAPVAHSVIAPANSSAVGPGTLIFTNGTVMPVLSTRVVPLPLLVSRTAKLPIAALSRPVAAHKTRVNHPAVSRSACANKDVPGTKSKNNSSNRPGTGKATHDMNRTHKPKKNLHLGQKPTIAGKVSLGGKARSPESLSAEKIAHDSKYTLSNAHEQATTQENVGTTSSTALEVNTTMFEKDKNESGAVKNDDIFNKVCTNDVITTKCDQSVDNINYDRCLQTYQKTSEGECTNKVTDINVNMAEAVDDFDKMPQEKSLRPSNTSDITEDCRGTNADFSHHKSAENLIPTFEINATDRPPFEMQIESTQGDGEMSVSSCNNVDVCTGTSSEVSATTNADRVNIVDCEKLNNTDKTISLDENKTVVGTSEVTSNNTECGNKRKRNVGNDNEDDDMSESYQLGRKKGRETNGKTDVNLLINLSDQESTSKQSYTTSDSVIKSNTKSCVVSTLPSHVSYSVDSLCKSKPLLKTSVTNSTPGSTQNTGPSSSATSENSVEQENASVHEELLDVMNHITSAAKSSIDSDNFNNVLCSTLLQEKYSEKSNFLQNTWLDQSVRQIFNEPDGSRELQNIGEHTNSQGTRTDKESNINEKSDFTLLNNTYPTSQNDQKVDNIEKEANVGSKLIVYESEAQGTREKEELYLDIESAPEREKSSTDHNSCESDRKVRNNYQNMAQEKGFTDAVSGTDLNSFNSITSKTAPNCSVPQNLATIGDSVKSPTDSLAKSSSSEDNTLIPGNCQSKTIPSAENVALIPEVLPKKSSDGTTSSNNHNSFSDTTSLLASQLHSEGMLNEEQSSVNRKLAVDYSSTPEFTPVSSNSVTTTRNSPSCMENIEHSKPSGAPLLPGTALYKQFKDICTVVSSVTDCVSTSSETVPVIGHNSTKPVEDSLSYNIQHVSESNSNVCVMSSENSISDASYNSQCAFKTDMEISKCHSVDQKLTKPTHLNQAVNDNSHSPQYTVTGKMMPILSHDMEQKLEKTIDMCASTRNQELVSDQQTKGNQVPRETDKSENIGDVRATTSQGNEKGNDGVLETGKGDCHNFFGSCHCSGSEFAGDLFASLNVPAGHCSESVSPTAQFLLSFPLVSGGSRAVDNVPDDTSVGQGAPSLLQIGVSEQSRSVGTQVCSSDTTSGTNNKMPGNSEQNMSTNNSNNNNIFMTSNSSFSKIANGSLPSITSDQHHLPLFKTPTNNHFSFTYESCGPVNKRAVETSPIKMPYGTSDSFHANFTLPEPCLASLPFDKTFDHNKSFQYTNLSKHPITGREPCHLPVSIPSGLCSSQQSNNVNVNLIQSDTLGSGIHKGNSGGTDLFKTPLPALSVQSISQNLQSSNSVCQVPVATSTGRFNGNNQSVTSVQNLSVTSFSCTDFTAMPIPQISSFGEDIKSTTMSSFSMANSSSNFGILSWSTIPPVAAVSNISHNESFTKLRNSSDGYLPNICPPTTKIGTESNNTKNCMQNSSLCKSGQQQVKDCTSEMPRHAQGIGPGYSFPIPNETGPETVSSRSVINSLMPSSVQSSTMQQNSYKMSLPSSQSELGSDILKGDYGNYRATVSVASESYKKFPIPQSDTYKLVTSHAEAVSRSSENQNYKQTSSPMPQNSYSVASSSMCGEAFNRSPLLHDKFKPQSSSQFDLYHSVPGITRSDVYRTSQENHSADIPAVDQCGHFKPDFRANQKEQFKHNTISEKPSNSKHSTTSDGVNDYNTNVASSFKQDSYRFLAVSSHCEQPSKPGPTCSSLDSYKSGARSNKLENYRKVPHSYQSELYKSGVTSIACETHKSVPSSVQYNSCKPVSSMPGQVNHLTNTQSRAPVNWMTTPDTRSNTQQISSLFFPPSTSSQMHTQNNTPLPSSAIFSSQCGHMNSQTATFTSVPSQTSQSVILPSVTSSLFPPVTCNHREAASNTHGLFPPASNTTYSNNGNSMTSNIFNPASSHASSFPQVQSSLFPVTTITTSNQSSVLFQSAPSNLLVQDNVGIPSMLLTSAASHVGQSGSSLMPLLSSVAGRSTNQSSACMPSITTMSITNQHSTDRPLASIPPALLATSSDPCVKSLSLRPPLSSTVKPVSGGTLPPNTASHLFSRDGGNSFCSGTIFQSFPSSGSTVHDSSPSVLLMPGSNVMGDAASTSLLCPSHVTAASSDFSSGSAPFFSSTLIPPVSSVASISGQNNCCLPSSIPSTLLSTHTSSGSRQRDLNLFPGPPHQHSYGRPSGPTFTGLPESGGASSTAAAPPRPCFLSVSQLVEGSGSGKIGATRNSRRRSRRPPPPWVSASSASGNLYQNIPHSQQSLTQPSSNKTVQPLCGRQPRPRAIPPSSSELVDLGGLLGSPLLAEDQPPPNQRPSSPPTSVSSLTNFNLSTIFPEIDKQQQQQQQQQSAAGYPKSTTMVSDAQQREFPHPPSTFGNVLMSPAQICRMQWP